MMAYHIMKILLSAKLFTIFVITILFSAVIVAPQKAQALADSCEQKDEIQIINVTIKVNNANNGNYDFNTSFVISGEINCLLPFTDIGGGYVYLTTTVLKDHTELSSDSPNNPLTRLNEKFDTSASSFPFKPIAFSLDPFIGSADFMKGFPTDQYDPNVWYIIFRKYPASPSDLTFTLASGISLPPNIEIINGTIIKITLHPATSNPNDIHDSRLILSCGFPTGRDDTQTCPDIGSNNNRPCCPSYCPARVIDNNIFCGYDESTIISPAPSPAPPLQPCQTTSGKLPENCNTALGRILTNPGGFIQSMFGILLSVSGMLALYLIIRSGYQLMTSRGNPEAIQAAKERLVSAIVGLLFIIFSLVILSVIGVDLLRIPGFS